MIKIESKILKAASLFQAKNDVRFYLKGICLQKGRVVATDGHTAIICEEVFLNDLEKNMIINICGTIPTKAGDATLQIIDDKKGIISFERNESLLAFNIIEGEFPDIDKVMPKESEAVSEIGINESYVVKAMKANKILNPKMQGLKFTFFGSSSSVVAESMGRHRKAKILIMPIRV